uniref:Uncharacterized protein n=1 Tax=Scophthalmus maximus TaxID=52904 RepID=A0A8D3C9A6_SCOMX
MGGDGHPVVIYLHGNVGTRWDESGRTRTLELILMESSGYCFGDSSGEPSEAGMTSDALYLYKWAKTQSKGSLVCLWGHSLGSPVEAIILESPYTRIGEVVVIHPVQQNMTKYSYRSFCGARFNVSFSPTPPHSLKFLTCPLLILHAEDDNVVPHHMGLTVRSYQVFPLHANLGFSHSNIYLDPNLPNVVR